MKQLAADGFLRTAFGGAARPAFVGLALALAACGKTHEAIDQTAAAKLFDAIQLPAVAPGESDLTVDDHGKLWAIAERDREAAEIELHGSAATVVSHPVEGVPDGNDTEAIAWLGANHFALGMEGQTAATAGVAFADLQPNGHLVVTRVRPLTDAEIGVALTKNHGAEAICGKGDELYVGIEERGKLPDGSWYAPLVHLRGTDPASVVKLHMTTPTGKLSAIDCHFAADGSVDFVGIERHYGVTRILAGAIAPGAADVVPQVQLDLDPVLHGALNLEGIARLSDGRTVLINDNQGAHVDGPTELLVLRR